MSFQLAIQPGSSYVDTFRFSSNPIVKEIYHTRIEPYIANYPTVFNIQNNVQYQILYTCILLSIDFQNKIELSHKIIDEPDFALFDNYFATINFEPYKSCKIIEIPGAYFPVEFAYTFQKNSPFFEAFWFHMNRMKETGATDQIMEKYKIEPQVI